MSMHHLVHEKDIKMNCIYCGKDLTTHTWESHFEGHFHYKTIVCKCGKKNRVKVNFLGSGHDTWDGSKSWKGIKHTSEKKLEATIREIEHIKELQRVDTFKK